MSYVPRDVSGLKVGMSYFQAGAWSDYFDSYRAMQELKEQIQWERHDTDRVEAFFRRKDVPYHYGPDRPERPYFPQDEPKMLKSIWDKVESFMHYSIEACFLNHYENSEGNIGWHQDNSPTMNHDKHLMIVTLGATRPLCVRPVGEKEFLEIVMPESGSLMVFEPGVQFTHQHCVPRVVNAHGERMSLVFRPLK